MKDMTLQQTKIMKMAMMWGIIDDAYIIGADEKETRNLRLIFKRLVACGYLAEHVVAQESRTYRPIKRYYMTPAGREALLAELPKEDPLMGIDEYQDISIRNGKNADKLARMVRMADTCVILEACGADTAYTAITREGTNPFVLGLPNRPQVEKREITQAEATTNALIDYIEVHRDGLKKAVDSPVRAIYLTNNQIPHGGSKASNNSLGMLFDISHSDAYMVFKSMDSYSFAWQPHAYNDIWSKAYHAKREWYRPIKRPYAYESLDKYAIIICKTEREVLDIARRKLVRYEMPFKHVFCITTKKDGLYRLRELLDLGWVDYVGSATRQIHELGLGTTFRDTHSPALLNLRFKNMDAYLGTVIDLALIDYLDKTGNKLKQKRYVFCHEWQRAIYSDIIDDDYIIIV